jgi:ATP synthase protein I
MDPDHRTPPEGGSQAGKEGGKSGLGAAGAYAGLGLQLTLSILLFLYAGQWLDRRLETAPVFLIIGVFVGAGAGFYAIYRKLMGDLKREEQERKSR